MVPTHPPRATSPGIQEQFGDEQCLFQLDGAPVISQDVAQNLIDSMPARMAEVLKKKGQHCKY